MAFPAFLDTCALFSPTLTDTLLRIAEEDAFRPHWSGAVLAELKAALVREGLPVARVEKRISSMESAFPDASVSGYEPLVGAMTCHPKDRHVLAAALYGRCEVLVTFNIKDFPPSSTASHQVAVVTPDEFLLDQLDLYPAKVGRALVGQMTTARRPRVSMGQLLSRLSRAGVETFAEEARRHEFS
jgi:predicted nucleic acid-binding protein